MAITVMVQADRLSNFKARLFNTGNTNKRLLEEENQVERFKEISFPSIRDGKYYAYKNMDMQKLDYNAETDTYSKTFRFKCKQDISIQLYPKPLNVTT